MDDLLLIGIKLDQKTTNKGGKSGVDCGNLWQLFESKRYADLIPNKLSDEIFAVYFDYEGDHNMPFSYFIGCKVEPGTTPPQGLQCLNIPEGNFIKIVAKGKMPECISDSWEKIWKSTISRSYKFDYEVYDQKKLDWNNARVDIYIST